MDFSKAFGGCAKISPILSARSAEETFVKGLKLVQQHGDNVDWSRVVEYYLRAADQGLPEACCNLGVCYATGRGVTQNPYEAVSWYRVAADKGLPRAQSNLAGCYASGRGVQQDWMIAAMWFQRAAESGDAAAACSLGALHAEGKGVCRDGLSAAYWFHRAAKHGLHSAMFNLALCYEQGTGCEPNPIKAVYWFVKAAAGNSSLATLASEHVAQLRTQYNVDVSEASAMDIDACPGDEFALVDPSQMVRRTGTDESRAGSTSWPTYCEQDMEQPQVMDCAITMEGDKICIDKHGKLKRKMSGIPEEGKKDGSGMFGKANTSRLFSILGFRRNQSRGSETAHN